MHPVLIFIATTISAQAAAADLQNAVIVCPPNLDGAEQKAVRMLAEEVEKRSRAQWAIRTQWPAPDTPAIWVGNKTDLADFGGLTASERQALPSVTGAEGFVIHVRQEGGAARVFVLGNDERGVLFGVGRLLRELHMKPGTVMLDGKLSIATAPKYTLRGHQLGYRPKTHSYDAWDLPVWEQYIRDLAVFGCNAIELIPPRSDDDADSPHFPRPPMDMMIGMSRLADEYGLDVWVWYPAMDPDYSKTETVENAVREWGAVFAKLPRLDAVFVPGGDPGHTQPKFLFSLLEAQTVNLHRYHPRAQMWVSPQGFTQPWMDEFLELLKREQPAWLSGIVFGPQVRLDLCTLREAVPAKYPIRHYPDITHTRQCQYPVPDWDVAYAVTEGRECINPRPVDEATIFRRVQPSTIGFITYSEGCNDDVNKTIWSALGWNPEMEVSNILNQYSRYFIGENQADSFASGLLALEQNWRGPLLSNECVEATLEHFQKMERAASPADRKNWRFQQALFRAYCDAYTLHRLRYETELETKAMEQLAMAPQQGALIAIAGAEKTLEQATTNRVKEDLRLRIHELAAMLFQSISMQLAVEKYRAIAVDRGAALDTIDFPLNNRLWLKDRFARIRPTSAEPDRLKGLKEILHWTDPGPGGFYDDLGNVARQPHLVSGRSFGEDPGRMHSARVGFEEDMVLDSPDEGAGVPRRISWMDHAETLYDTPLRMRYTGLDPRARYMLRVVYGGDNPKRKMRLVANDTIEIHPLMPKPVPFAPIEFALPPGATATGELNLTWSGEPGLGGNGRGCQVSEVWLIKDSPAENR